MTPRGPLASLTGNMRSPDTAENLVENYLIDVKGGTGGLYEDGKDWELGTMELELEQAIL